MPARFNAAVTDKNYRAYAAYGNHSTVDDDPDQARQTLVKEQKKGYCVPLDKRVLPFILHSHLTPIGIINIGHPYKKARLIHDASFRPEPWAVAINDMTDCSTEPPITFGPAFDTFLLWVANLRASHPTDEIYLGEDDVGGAFRHNKYHPDVVGAHAYELSGYGVLATGSTFGGTTSPPNWNAVAACRQARAQCHSVSSIQYQSYTPGYTTASLSHTHNINRAPTKNNESVTPQRRPFDYNCRLS
jgi:hypothetical protein